MGDDDEDWITAAEALALVRPLYDTDEEPDAAIVKQAGAGLIEARARRAIGPDSREDNILVGPLF